ncbi:MAG: hypothetical protein KC613_05810, partial [Myxococcales bacterium]|nr:hypothetical protein [Myxococcales bacterium]
AAEPALAEFAPLVLDTEAAIAAFKAQVPLPGPAVRVLDHSVLLYGADGKRLRWVHEVLAIRSRDAAETYGEIGLPQGTRIVALYTRKADGRIRHGEEVPEKDSITLPELEAGDFVVAQYLEPGDNGYLYDKGFLTPRVFFQGVDLPIHRQRFEVYGPDDTPPDIQVLAGAPEPTPVRLGERAGWRVEVRKVDQEVQEPDLPPAARWLPSARAGRKVSLADDLAYLRDRALARRRKTLAFEAWVREHAGDGEPAAQVKRLARAVREAVDDQQGVIEEDAARAVETGNGNRALVLSAALEVLGVPHRLWQGRPAVHEPPGPFTQVSHFPYPLIFWAGGVLDPGPERAPLGFMPFTLVSGDGIQVWPIEGARAEPQPLPAPRTVGDRRRVKVDAEWGADGVLRGEVEDRLEGQEAIVVGHHLSRLDPAQRPRLVERLLVAAVGAAKVTALEDPAAQDPDGPLLLRYRFEAQVGDRLGLALFPTAPARTHAPLPERELPLYISLPTDQRVVWRLASDRDFTCPPAAPVALAHGPHRFTRTVECDGDDLKVVSTVKVAGGELPVADYAAFAAWARQVDEAERLRLVIPAVR